MKTLGTEGQPRIREYTEEMDEWAVSVWDPGESASALSAICVSPTRGGSPVPR